MSDTQQGPEWWLGTDGKWYPPAAPAPSPPPSPSASDMDDGSQAPVVSDTPWWREHLVTLIAFGITALAVVITIVLTNVSNDDSSDPIRPAASGPSYTPPRVTYKVEGTATSADITIDTGSGTSQQSGVDVPLTSKSTGLPGISFDASYGDFLYISAQNNGSYGTLICIIEVDGRVVSRNQSSGAYTIATCSGRV